MASFRNSATPHITQDNSRSTLPTSIGPYDLSLLNKIKIVESQEDDIGSFTMGSGSNFYSQTV